MEKRSKITSPYLCLIPKAHHRMAGARDVTGAWTPRAGMLGHRHYFADVFRYL